MGAFVGAVTSPFFRRRKGRMGKDRFVEMTAPALAGAEVRYAAANDVIIACGANAAAAPFVSKDDSATWTNTLAWPAPDVVGNGSEAGPCLVRKPAHIQAPLADNRLYGCGIHPGIGGALMHMSQSGLFTVESLTVAGAPTESFTWDSNGEFFCGVGANVLGNGKCFGGRINLAPESFDVPTVVALGVQTVMSLENDPKAGPKPSFMAGDAAAAGDTAPFHKLRRRNAADWAVRDISQTSLGFAPKKFIQRENLLIVIGDGNPEMQRSFDYGETWTPMPLVFGNKAKDIYRYGGKWFYLTRDSSRVFVSVNNGATWQAFSPALPSATAEPNVSCVHKNERYIFCRDGAANRVYKHKHSAEI